jgi:hypothetical protein
MISTLILLVVQTMSCVFSQEIMIQPVLQSGHQKTMVKESTGLTVHPGDSLYLEVTSSTPSQVNFFQSTAIVNVAIVEGSTILFQQNYTGTLAFNKINIVRTQAQYFQQNRKLILTFENTQGLKEIVLPIK